MKILLASLVFIGSCFLVGGIVNEDCSALPMPVGASYDVHHADYGVWSIDGEVIGYSAEEDEPILPFYDCL